MFVAYLMSWQAMTLLGLSLSIGNNLDHSRTLLKKELSDTVILMQLITKALSGTKVQGSALSILGPILRTVIEIIYK